MTKQERKRVEDTFNALEDELEVACPSSVLASQPMIKGCSEEFCLSHSGAECWKRYILGEYDD